MRVVVTFHINQKIINSSYIEMKLLILLVYFDRPNLVHNALHSIRMLSLPQDCDYEVAAIDDGSEIPLETIVDMHYKDIYNKFKFYRCDDSREDKERNGGSLHGLYLNKAMYESDADGACILCDDDALMPDLLLNLNSWLVRNPNEFYGYWHVADFNPLTDRVHSGLPRVGQNNHTARLNGNCMVDASQVYWKLDPIKTHGLEFPYPQTACLDAYWFQKLYESFGNMGFMGFFGEYKARFPFQLGQRDREGRRYSNTEE